MMRPTEYIYALVDPRSDVPFYIGRSIQPEKRVYMHLSIFASQAVKSCVDEIRAAGMEPTWKILEETTSGRAAECQWVQQCIAKGVTLANSFRRNNYSPRPEDLTDRRLKMPSREGPEGDETQVNISGLPVEYRDAMRAVANTLSGPRRGRLKRAYTEAIVGLLNELDKRPKTQLHGSVKGGSRLIVWIPSPVAEKLDAYCKNRAFKNGFFVTAVHRYLTAKGQL